MEQALIRRLLCIMSGPTALFGLSSFIEVETSSTVRFIDNRVLSLNGIVGSGSSSLRT